MIGNILTLVSTVAAAISAIVSLVALILTIRTQNKLKQKQRKHITIEAFGILQNEVLDKLASVDKKNAQTIVDSLDNEECRRAYNDYKTLIARLDHFAVGIDKEVYDFDIVKELADEHLFYVYKKVKPIIDHANRVRNGQKRYSHFVDLVSRLNTQEDVKK